jgi:Ca2+-binding RTX toxin-like protein
MTGMAGNDTMNGFAGEDKIDALEPQGDTIGGKDTISGGPGNDTIAANDGFKDRIDCGPGSKDIAYSDKGLDRVSNCEWRRSYDTPRYCSYKEGPPWTGPPASWSSPEGPNDWPYGIPWVGEKSIWCIDGTPRDDKKLVGKTGRSDVIDSIWSDKGDDTLNGGLGTDFLEGWSGNDILKGGAGTDFLYGDSSRNPDDSSSIPGYDSGGFFKRAGEDKIYGGPGDDFIGAIDNKKDTISCGGGNDVVQRDKRGVAQPGSTEPSTVTDKVANDCETRDATPEGSSFWCRWFGHRGRR